MEGAVIRRLKRYMSEALGLANSVNGVFQVLIDRVLMNTERTSHAYSWELTCMNQTVNGHLRDSHHVSDLSDRQKGSLIFISHSYLTLRHEGAL